jgi:uncharacterized protein (DUF2147 family)
MTSRFSSLKLMACGFSLVHVALAMAGISPARAQAGGEINGIWLTQAGDAKVRVSKCGAGICGAVVWLRTPIDPATARPAIPIHRWPGAR